MCVVSLWECEKQGSEPAGIGNGGETERDQQNPSIQMRSQSPQHGASTSRMCACVQEREQEREAKLHTAAKPLMRAK